MKTILLDCGYTKQNYGYVQVTIENTHWVTLFEDNSLQMYAYFTEDAECDKIYDTGIISVTESELKSLINILIGNHK